LTGKSDLDLVIFDCDGVLVDSEVLSRRGFQIVLDEAGITVPDGVIETSIGLKQADIFARIAAAAGKEIGPEIMARLWPRTRELFEAELQPTRGLIAFLESLEGARCVASSSHPERIRLSLALAGLDRFFGGSVFSAYQVARGKPWPDLFLFAAASMGVAPDRCAVVEDSVPGVRAAVAAGMRVLGYVGGQHIGEGHDLALKEAGASLVAGSWTKVARWLVEPPGAWGVDSC
jgi:HAD superfamily hydrolase (TIGR01509 family)